uniref:PLC-like phosphodiesterase n=1 Tax=Mycena chlorophos TaxID=658473 RepID=A0ABQ0LA02_MYCCL|nr:PLC-like phosphodiesterase [Mycena chlorophos]
MMIPSANPHFLADHALQEILERAAPILGRTNDPVVPTPQTAHWMAKVPDDTRLVDMNLPGTHDAATWNYSAERQKELEKYTGPIYPNFVFRCQDRSLLQSLDDGIRVFDLRLGYNPGDDTIGFWHGRALLSPTTSFEDVLFGLYHWLLAHPTETILVSIQQEEGSLTTYDKKFETILHTALSSPLAQRFWRLEPGRLGTLGEARGKMVLLQRFTYEFLSDVGERHEFGIHLGAAKWTPNGADIRIVYNEEPKRVAYVEDEFKPGVPANSGTDATISKKFSVLTGHLEKSLACDTPADVEEALFVSFASAHANHDKIPITPNVMALGDGVTAGINERLLPWVQARRGQRLGIILLDFYASQPELVEAIIGL